MIPVFGEAFLGMAWLMSGLLFLIAGGYKCAPQKISPARFKRMTSFVTHANTFLVTAAFLALIICYVRSDFSVLNVVLNSHTAKPLIYKISGAWGNHEGSMLLWALVLVGFSWAVLKKGGELAHATLVILHFITFLFLSFILFTSNPFVIIYPVPLEGQGLNPLLQDIGLAIHPPMLYLGYVGFSVPFAMALAGLWRGMPSREWARAVKPFVLVAWGFLTLGIGLGSWWAYRELGWGGFWFWDPVENASLMPWLSGAALLHSLLVMEKRGLFRRWTMLLAIITFSLSLIGTFLVRSGVLTSVHAFANDPERGVFILLILAIVTGGGLLVFALKAEGGAESSHPLSPLSREGMLLFNNLLLVVACAIVFLGTLYPLFLQLWDGTNVSIGPPYYAATFSPVALPLLLFAAIAPALAWKKGDAGRLRIQLIPIGVGIVAMLCVYWVCKLDALLGILAIGGAFWLLSAMLLLLVKRLQAGKPPFGFYAMIVAHVGLAVLVVGITGAVYGALEKDALLKKGGEVTIGDYRLDLHQIAYEQGANYFSRSAHFNVYKGADEITTLIPEYRFYPVEGEQTSEAAIYSAYGLSDLYVVIGEYSEASGYRVRAYYKPLINLIWLGTLLMAIGAVFGVAARKLKT